MNSAPLLSQKEMIERSLRCFVFGLLGLLPLIGIPMALYSRAQYRRVKRGQGGRWNPAHRYVFWGGVCARMGLALFLVIPAVVFFIAVIWYHL
ncbi:MAG: hypothetical protein ABSF38_06330 [Verrucomicrobiota bacterium]|jgi:hypothetical protein